MFKTLTDEERDQFIAWADEHYELPTSDLVIRSIYHPVVRIRLAERVIEDARRQLDPETCPVCGQPDNCGDCNHTPND